MSKEPKPPFAVLGGAVFRTKTAAREWFRDSLQRMPLRGCPAAKEHPVWCALATFHPEAVEKIGCGILRFEKRVNVWNGYRTKGAWIVRNDESAVDLSYLECLDGISCSGNRAFRDFANACRGAVMPATRAFRDANLANAICPITGAKLTRENAHVDHAPPNTFGSILAAFMAMYDVDLETIAYRSRYEKGSWDWGLPPELERAFVDLHNQAARLRLISAEANMSGGQWK